MKNLSALLFLTFFAIAALSSADELHNTIDSIRRENDIPEIGYAIVCDDSLIRAGVVGVHRWGVDKRTTATMYDRFLIGSCTKSITALVAAVLVKQGMLKWDTKFFTLYPDLKPKSRSEYYTITLEKLLSHRASIQPFESGEELQAIPKHINLFDPASSVSFAEYALSLPPVADSFHYSNAGYTLAALMLERASDQPWDALVTITLYENFGIAADFSFPNLKDSSQLWYHTPDSLKPLSANDLKQGNYILPAVLAPGGNVNLTVPDFANYLQIQLKGLLGKSKVLDQQSFELMHYGFPDYSLGWYNQINADSTHTSFHFGNVSNLCYSMMTVHNEKNLATLVVTNCATEKTHAAVLAVNSALSKAFNPKK